MQTVNAESQRAVMYPSKHWLRLLGAILFSISAFLLVVLAFLAAFGIARFTQSWSAAATAFGSSLPILGVALFCWAESQEYVASSPTGLEFQGFGYRIFSRWENLDAIRIITASDHALDPTGTKTRSPMEQEILHEVRRKLTPIQSIFPQELIEVLYLYQPVEVQRARWIRGILTPTRKLRLSDYQSWRSTPVGQDMRRYAPQLKDYEVLQQSVTEIR